MAEAKLEALLADARATAEVEPLAEPAESSEAAPTFGDAVEAWLRYLEVEKLRKKGTVQDA